MFWITTPMSYRNTMHPCSVNLKGGGRMFFQNAGPPPLHFFLWFTTQTIIQTSRCVQKYNFQNMFIEEDGQNEFPITSERVNITEIWTLGPITVYVKNCWNSWIVDINICFKMFGTFPNRLQCITSQETVIIKWSQIIILVISPVFCHHGQYEPW